MSGFYRNVLEHLQGMGWTGTVEVYGNDEDDGDCDGVETEQDCNDNDSMLAFDEDQNGNM